MIFQSFLSIFLIAASHAAEVSVSSRGHASNPVWSPNGKQLAFELNEYSGRIDLYTISIEKGVPSGVPKRLILNVNASNFGGDSGIVAAAPVWHPKQNGMLFFEGSYTGGSNRIYVSSSSGSPPQQLLKQGQIKGDLSFPAVSTDGKKLVFVSDVTGKGDVFSYSLESLQLQHLVRSEHSEMAPRYDKGGRLAYSRKRGGGEDIFVLKNGASQDWVGGNGDQTRPIWAGGSVLFFSNERGTALWDVVVSDNPKQKRNLAKGVRLPFRAPPALSPDQKWVAYGLEDSTKSGKIWFSRLDGSRVVSFDTGHVACGEPNLTTANGRIYLAYTALPAEGSDWRQLHVRDVTDLLR